MTSKNKVRGNKVETETVKLFQDKGLVAKRAWGSNGKAMDQHEEVDVLVPRQTLSKLVIRDEVPYVFKFVVQDLKIQCKRKKKLPDWLGLTKNVDAVVVREDRGRKFILLDLEDFITRFLL